MKLTIDTFLWNNYGGIFMKPLAIILWVICGLSILTTVILLALDAMSLGMSVLIVIVLLCLIVTAIGVFLFKQDTSENSNKKSDNDKKEWSR